MRRTYHKLNRPRSNVTLHIVQELILSARAFDVWNVCVETSFFLEILNQPEMDLYLFSMETKYTTEINNKKW